MTYGHPKTDGPTRFIKYSKAEVLKYFASNRNSENKRKSITEGPHSIGIQVYGLLTGVVMAALLCREKDLPLSNIFFDAVSKTVWIKYGSEDMHDAYKKVAYEYIEQDLWHIDKDRWGNELFSCGKTISAEPTN